MIPQIDEYGRIIETEDSLVELLYQGATDLTAGGEAVEKYNRLCAVYDMIDAAISPLEEIQQTPEEYHAERQLDWLVPTEYMEMDIAAWLLTKCVTDTEINRVTAELVVFNQLGLVDVLRAVKYVVDVLDASTVVRGVGRGSSVASYCLYLLGVHSVDSLKYDLNFSEFLSTSK